MSFEGDRNQSFVVVSMENDHQVDMDEELSARIDALSMYGRERDNSQETKYGPRDIILSYDEAYDGQNVGATSEAFESVVAMCGVGVGVGGVLERSGAERVDNGRSVPAMSYHYGDCSSSDEYAGDVVEEDKHSKAAYRNLCFSMDDEAAPDCRVLDNKENCVPAPSWNEPSISNTRIYYSYNESEQYSSSKPCGCVASTDDVLNSTIIKTDNQETKDLLLETEKESWISDSVSYSEALCQAQEKEQEKLSQEQLPNEFLQEQQPNKLSTEVEHEELSQEPQLCDSLDRDTDKVPSEHIIEVRPSCPEVYPCDEELPTYRSLIAFRLTDCPPNYETVTGIPVNVNEIRKDITGSARGRFEEEIRSCSDLNSSAKRLLALMATIIIAICVVMIILTI